LFRATELRRDQIAALHETSEENHQLEIQALKEGFRQKEEGLKKMLEYRDAALALGKQHLDTILGVDSRRTTLLRETHRYLPDYKVEDIRNRWYFAWTKLQMIAPSERNYPDQKQLTDSSLEPMWRVSMQQIVGTSSMAEEAPVIFSRCFDKLTEPPNNNSIFQAILSARVCQWLVTTTWYSDASKVLNCVAR
jgi:hypothetical protein